jgi:signal transduction histidine kinase
MNRASLTLKNGRLWLKTHPFNSSYIFILVFIVGCVASAYVYKDAKNTLNNNIRSEYQHQFVLAESLISLRLQQYSSLLTGGVGLFSSTNVSQSEWQTYYSTYNIPQNFPGVDGVSYAEYVTNANLPSYLSNMVSQGYNSIIISPAGNRPVYAPVTYIASTMPINSSSFGYDPLSNPTRAAAMINAENSGSPVMSGKLSLRSTHVGQPAFIIYDPVYNNSMPISTEAERQTAINGYVFASMNMNNLFNSILNEVQNDNFVFRIYDGTSLEASNLMYQSSDFSTINKHSLKSETRPFIFDKHTWDIQAVAGQNFISITEKDQPLLDLFRGIFFSAVLAWLIRYIINKRELKLLLQKQQEIQLVKDDLLTLASHQLRTPATIVKQYLGILLHNYGGKITDQQRSIIQTAYESNERQLEIANQFLSVAKLDSGRLKIKLEKVSINPLIESVVSEQKKIVKERGQSLTHKLPKRSYVIQADPTYLPMVFENLISNASKYTSKRGKLNLSVRKSNNEVLITVSDNGIGISEEEISIIFDKFTRAENDLTADANGSGIGLYLVRQVVNLHNGHIEVKSTIKKGSSFIVHLPLK